MNRYLKLVIGSSLAFLGLAFIVFFNVQPSPSPSPSISQSPSNTSALDAFDVEGCYAYLADDGTRYTLFIEAKDERNFLGFVEYNNPGFDSSRGGITGTFENPLALGIYEFEAEGSFSKQQLAFFYEEPNFVRGYTDMEIIDGVEKFIDLDNITRNYDYVYVPDDDCARS